jgi:hypothetical protein
MGVNLSNLINNKISWISLDQLMMEL